MALTVAGAYDATGAAWETGPGRVYNHLADVLISLAPSPLTNRVVLDVGAGTGAASRAINRAGGHPIALDIAHGMLAVDRCRRPPSVAADAAALPFRDGQLGGAVAAFVLNHSHRPADALCELRRVCAAGSPLVVSAYAHDDAHPVKGVVDEALVAAGWEPEAWYHELRRDAMPRLASIEGAAAIAREAQLDAQICCVRVPMPWLDTDDLIAWRLGMAQHAPFVRKLSAPAVGDVMRAARRRLGADPPPLVRSIIVLTAIVEPLAGAGRGGLGRDRAASGRRWRR